MAEYVRLRLTAAKIGVTMTFLALLAGITERARANPPLSGPSGANFLQGAVTPDISGAGTKLVVKLDRALGTLEHRLATTYYTRGTINREFLKIKSANSQFLKIRSADTDFLKIDTANAQFLKIDSANASFLKIENANAEFLKIDGTAANASELGGQTPDAFFQGHGNVASGAAMIAHNGTPGQVVALPGGIIVVKASANVDGSVTLDVVNNSGGALPAVQRGSTTTAITLVPGDNAIAASSGSQAAQTTLQILPQGAFRSVVSLIISIDPLATGQGTSEVVAQAFTGGV